MVVIDLIQCQALHQHIPRNLPLSLSLISLVYCVSYSLCFCNIFLKINKNSCTFVIVDDSKVLLDYDIVLSHHIHRHAPCNNICILHLYIWWHTVEVFPLYERTWHLCRQFDSTVNKQTLMCTTTPIAWHNVQLFLYMKALGINGSNE